MEMFFETPFAFWYLFVFLFLFVTGVTAVIQCRFMIKFCGAKSRKGYYAVYLLISYALYLYCVFSPFQVSPIFDALAGFGVIFLFLNRLLKQGLMLSAVTAALTMAVTSIAESVAALLEFITSGYTRVPGIAGNLIFLLISLSAFELFFRRYRVKIQYRERYLPTFALPIIFVAAVLKMINYIRYSFTENGIVLRTQHIQNGEMVIITAVSFFCVALALFALGKALKQIEGERIRQSLAGHISAQKSYVLEVRQKYESTRAFRHDFKNHVSALQGLVKLGDTEKTAAYLERFNQMCCEITFPVNTGNSVADIVLSKKLSVAKRIGIEVKCSGVISEKLRVDDFDFCSVLSNTVDNAVKASVASGDEKKNIEVILNTVNEFLVIIITNNYKQGSFIKGSGMGLETTKSICKKYGGVLEITQQENSFRVSIILPL